jgi:small subunit ribosomal protein S16
MSVKLRLQRKGRRKKPFYHIVVADARAPRDGRFIEKIGSYNPMTSPATIEVDTERALDWLFKGAQPTDTVRAILRFKGVMYKKHVQRGVLKGALTQEKADQMYADFMKNKGERVSVRIEASKQADLDRKAAISGTAKVVEVVEDVVVQATEAAESASDAVADAAEEVVETTTEAVEAAAEVIEEKAEAAVESVTETVEVAADKVEEVAAETAESAKEVAEDVVETTTDDKEEK